ncbi:hypothetical protein AB9F35_34880, partial [Rhizobium leguminosarum]
MPAPCFPFAHRTDMVGVGLWSLAALAIECMDRPRASKPGVQIIRDRQDPKRRQPAIKAASYTIVAAARSA